MFEIFHNNKKEETLGDKSSVLDVLFEKQIQLAVGYMSLEITAGNKKFKPCRE